MKTYVLQTSPIPHETAREAIASWFRDVPYPLVLDISATSEGVRVRAQSSALPSEAFSAMTRHAFRWKEVEPPDGTESVWFIKPHADLPYSEYGTDPFLLWAGRLKQAAATFGREVVLRTYIVGRDDDLHAEVRALSAYQYGTSAGVSDDEPNTWALRLALYRALAFGGILGTAVPLASYTAGWLSPLKAAIVASGGLMLFAAGLIGVVRWLQVRNIPREVLEAYASSSILRVAFALVVRDATPVPTDQAHSIVKHVLSAGAPVAGPTSVHHVQAEMALDVAEGFARPLPAAHMAALVSPPESGDPAALLHEEDRSDVPTPPPTRALKQAPFKVGVAVATGESVGIDPDGHGLVIGGSRSGKSSLAAGLLRELLNAGDDAPGLLLIDPHLSLSDAFLSAIDALPPAERESAISRLFVVSPDQPEVIPLNILTVPDFSWAASTLIQVGKRLWMDYWGPRMQAAFVALAKLVHGWNQKHPPAERYSLVHTIFGVFNPEWRKTLMCDVPPEERPVILAFEGLMGELADAGRTSWQRGWTTEVASPIISKVMELTLSPWVFQALAQPTFCDMASLIRERKWVVVRAPAGQMGVENMRLLTSIFYNMWEAAFRNTATADEPIPTLALVDEAQEIASGMRLESLLAEGAKFGARLFVLTQSLAMMRKVEGMDIVVQSLLANTSTQAFFSPDPDDYDVVQRILSSDLRYGEMVLDLPNLHCWLRARVGGRWQPPTVLRCEPLPHADHEGVNRVIRESIEKHRDYYVHPKLGVDIMLQQMMSMVGERNAHLLGHVIDRQSPSSPPAAETPADGERGQDERFKRLGL